jgi:hypothetical protein
MFHAVSSFLGVLSYFSREGGIVHWGLHNWVVGLGNQHGNLEGLGLTKCLGFILFVPSVL